MAGVGSAAQGVEEPGSRELQPGDEVEAEVADATDSNDPNDPSDPNAANDSSASNDAAAAIVADDPETLLHEAMDAYASAGVSWDRGAADEAIAALDRAYEKMTRIALEPSPAGDAVLSKEKENLRRLISRRIVEIYAARQTSLGDTQASIPRDMNPDVAREIASFQGRERAFFLEAYRRSGLYRPMIVAQLQEAGLPEQLSWLPLVESGFKDRALSSARALGLWQFIASTGYRYGLDRSNWVDERMDPEKSTKAALAYLTALHELFGDWLTALAAYNCGEHNVLRQINNSKVSYLDQFWDLYSRLPHETRRYVPRFLATLAILENPARYGFELPEPYAPVPYETAELARATQLEQLDRALALESGNPGAPEPGAAPERDAERTLPAQDPPRRGAGTSRQPRNAAEVGSTAGGERAGRGCDLSRALGRHPVGDRRTPSHQCFGDQVGQQPAQRPPRARPAPADSGPGRKGSCRGRLDGWSRARPPSGSPDRNGGARPPRAAAKFAIRCVPATVSGCSPRATAPRLSVSAPTTACAATRCVPARCW